jgi:nucleoside-diphosphate-sugar epimerase
MRALSKEDKILVTGAAGFTGGALARRLASSGLNVRGTARPGSDTQQLEEAGVDVCPGDIGDPRDVARMVAGRTHIFHIAALFRRAGVADSEYARVNIEGTRYLLDAAISEGVRKVIHCSTIGVCGHIANPPADEHTPYNPGDIYQRTKMEGEKLALEYFRSGKIDGSVVRPASIYGPGDLRLLKLFRMINKRRFVVVGNGKPTFHTVYIDDLVDAFILAMESEASTGEVFIAAGPDYVPLNTLFADIAEELDVPPPRLRVPAWPIQLLGTIVEKICIPFGVEPPIYRRRVDFFTKNRAFDISKARTVLGYDPKIDVREGIHRTAEWYREGGMLS